MAFYRYQAEDCLFLGRLKSIFGWGRLVAERT